MSSYTSNSYAFGSTSGPAETPRVRVPLPDEQLTQPEICARLGWTAATFDRAAAMSDFPRARTGTAGPRLVRRWSKRAVEQWRDHLVAFAQSLGA